MKRLKDLMAEVVIREGDAGKQRLAASIGCSIQTIDRYMSGDYLPPYKRIYPLALACGCSDREAVKLAKERLSDRAS